MRGPVRRTVHVERRLRSQQTDAERKLWLAVRDRRLSGFKFVRQEAIGPFIVDFVCRESLVVEVDGATHGSDVETANDAARTANLERMGYRVCRVTNDDVERNIDGVLEWLLRELEVGR